VCVVPCRGLCDGLITRPEESYRVQCVCDREALRTLELWDGDGDGGVGGTASQLDPALNQTIPVQTVFMIHFI